MLEVKNLVKAYGDKVALNDVTFAISPGEVCGYIGPNGAGKSTTVKILIGVLKATSGFASVCGCDVSVNPLEVKRRIGYVPENANVYSALTCEEYLTFTGTVHGLSSSLLRERVSKTLELFGLSEATHMRIDTLSKGMRQKVVIAAALLHDPAVLIFDEPLSGLDANASSTVKDVVRQLADRGKTILYCSHVLEVVERICDRVLIVDSGKIVAAGTPAELMQAADRPTLEKVFRAVTSNESQSKTAADIVHAVSMRAKSSEGK